MRTTRRYLNLTAPLLVAMNTLLLIVFTRLELLMQLLRFKNPPTSKTAVVTLGTLYNFRNDVSLVPAQLTLPKS